MTLAMTIIFHLYALFAIGFTTKQIQMLNR